MTAPSDPRRAAPRASRLRALGLLVVGLALAGCAKSFDELRDDLRDDDPYVRLMAAVALGRSGRTDAGPALLMALSDSRPEVREAARDSLVLLGPVVVPVVLERLAASASGAGEANLRRLDLALLLDPGLDEAAPAMRALQAGRYDRKALEFFELIRAMGPAAVAPLGERLADPDPALAAAAADALAAIGPAAAPAAAPLVEALARPEVEVVRAAAAALGACAATQDEVLAALLRLAQDPRPAARQAAVDAAVSGLLQRMAAGGPARRDAALATLTALGPDALDALIRALVFEDEPLAAEAAASLAASGPDVLPRALAALNPRNRQHVERGALLVRRLGPPALPALLAMIEDPAEPARVIAAAALSELGADASGAWPALLALLGETGELAAAAAYTLGGLAPPDDAALQQLVAARAAASSMIAQLLLPAVVRGLLERGRLDELRALGDEGAAVLEGLRRGGDPELAARAAAALGALSAPPPR